MKILSVVGARPNFMKVAPVHAAFLQHGHDAFLVHTGQHYDDKMSAVFFDELGMPKPNVNLAVGSASHAVQTARIMEAFEPVLLDFAPDWLLVAGDVNSTIACTLVATKLGVRVAHLEAGLRSFDRTMPEEINRVLTDQISDLLLTPSPDADANLLKEGIPQERIALVGNAMIDSLRQHAQRAACSDVLSRLGVQKANYGLITLHRPSNVDSPEVFERLMDVFVEIAAKTPFVWPLHPRARSRLSSFGLMDRLVGAKHLQLVEPQGYLDFLALQMHAKLVLTDSGGIQEETTALGVPCLTLRENTERPITITQGTNTLVGTAPQTIHKAFKEILSGRGKAGRVPGLWDGNTAERVVQALASK